MMIAEGILAEEPSSGMTLVAPEDCALLLRLCTVMGWKPKLPLHIMRDSSAGRWFMKGMPGAQDYWIRDTDIEVLKKTPMWLTVQTAVPYGLPSEIKPKPGEPPEGWDKIKPSSDHWRKVKEATTATEIERRMAEGHRRLQELVKIFPDVDKDDALDMYTAMAKAAREKAGADLFLTDDPVDLEKQRLAKQRLEAEAALKKLDEWE